MSPRGKEILAATRALTLISPASLTWEVGNALSAAFKQKRLSLDDALVAIRDFSIIEVRQVTIELDGALRLAYTLNIYAYDAYMILCAKSNASRLLTLDRGLRAAAKRAGVDLLEPMS
jgi:predicted nucleic acid-binding protein